MRVKGKGSYTQQFRATLPEATRATPFPKCSSLGSWNRHTREGPWNAIAVPPAVENKPHRPYPGTAGCTPGPPGLRDKLQPTGLRSDARAPVGGRIAELRGPFPALAAAHGAHAQWGARSIILPDRTRPSCRPCEVTASAATPSAAIRRVQGAHGYLGAWYFLGHAVLALPGRV